LPPYQLKTVALLGGLSALLIGLGGALAPGQIWLFVALAAAMNLISYFFSDRIVLAMNRAQPIREADDPALFGIVRELAARASIPMPKVYVVDEAAPNAFATGRNPEHGVVAVTRGLRALLSERELRGVLAHEIAHIANRDILIATIAAMIASVVSLVASMLQWSVFLGGGRRDDDDRDPGDRQPLHRVAAGARLRRRRDRQLVLDPPADGGADPAPRGDGWALERRPAPPVNRARAAPTVISRRCVASPG